VANNPVPSIQERKAQLGRHLEDLQVEPDSPSGRERFKATEDALNRQDQALQAEQAYEQSNRSAQAAEKKAVDSNDPADRRAAAELKAEAEARKADANAAEKKAEEAFRAPQETARQEKADALGLQADVIDADKEYKRANALANEAQAKADKSDNPADKEKAAELKSKAAQLKDKGDDTLKRAQDAAKSPVERRNLDALRDASPEEQDKVAKQREDLNSKRYVTPKNSPLEGEVLVRKFKPDEIVPKGGLRLHVEADANGRRDFKVKGWRLGLSPFVAKERFEEFVPIGPDLDVDVPLDLSFQYRGRDGKIHEDTAPFTLQGDLTIGPRVKIRKFKERDEASQQKPIPKEKFDPKRGA
jgi:chemotaxis protein histidine kinase CheA